MVEFNEPVTVGIGDAGFSIMNIYGDHVIFTQDTDYIVSDSAGNLEITVTMPDLSDFGITVELISGLQISDQAGNHPAPFGVTNILKADGSPGG